MTHYSPRIHSYCLHGADSKLGLLAGPKGNSLDKPPTPGNKDPAKNIKEDNSGSECLYCLPERGASGDLGTSHVPVSHDRCGSSDLYVDWNISWQMYQSAVLGVQPEREEELQKYSNCIGDFFLLMRPQVHSLIVELDKAERTRAGGFEEFVTSDDPESGGREEGNSNDSSIVVREGGASLGGQALGRKWLVSVDTPTFWKALARNLFRMVTFSIFN